jgi:POT family proton-dependent oligopeptide transporter
LNNNASSIPSSIKVFYGTELWERYGFYVVQTLLALYLAYDYHWPDNQVYVLVGSFTALTYITPLIGGFIADHLLGQKRTVIVGGIVLFFSYLLLALMHQPVTLGLALGGIAVGTGLLKPNISSLLGNELTGESVNRDRGFTLFYTGITTGIFIGSTLPSHIQSYFGWTTAFVSAAIGMLLSLAIFIRGIKYYQIEDYHPIQLTMTNQLKAFTLIIGLFISCWLIIQHPDIGNLVFSIAVILSVTYFLSIVLKEPKAQAKQTWVLGLLCLISVVFWAFYFQMFLSLTLFISRVVKPELLGIAFPPPYYVAIQSLGIILFAYLFPGRPKNLTKREQGISITKKFIMAIVVMIIAYLLITLACYFSKNTALLSPWWFIPPYLCISIAELLISPVGLSAMTLLASRKRVSTMVGLFFVSLGIGAFLAGKLANITALSLNDHSLNALKAHYFHSFELLLFILMGASILCLGLTGVIYRLLSPENQEPI